MKAVAAHREWYRSHGQGDHEIFVARIVVRGQPEPQHDTAYEAFVKLYRDNSDIKQQYDICMPKPELR